MDHLWAPWRMKFIRKCKTKDEGCIFCEKPNVGNGHARSLRKNHVLEKTKHSFVILNIYPYNNGHLMIAPFRHITKLSELTHAETCDLFELLKKWEIILSKALEPHAFNIGANIGKSAGAGYDHLHFHIVPRWPGDSNFMPVIADTKVLNMSLNMLYDLLKKYKT